VTWYSIRRPAADARVTRAGVRRLVAVLLVLGAITAVMAGPMTDYAHLDSAVARGDARLIVWTMAWEARALQRGMPLFQSNIYYPDPESLHYNEHILGLSLFAWPVIAATGNAVLAYNLLFLAAWVLNGLGAYLLARRFTDDTLAAFVGCLVYAFSSFRILHASAGHLAWAWTCWLPLSILAWDRWYREPTWRRTAWVVVTVTLQALTSWYLAVMVALTSALWLLCLGIAGHRYAPRQEPGALRAPGVAGPHVSWRHVVSLGVVAAAVAVVLLPLAWHYRGLVPASPGEAAVYSPDIVRYVVPPYWTIVGGWLVRQRLMHAVASTETLIFPGWAMWTLAAAGAVVTAWPVARRRWLPTYTVSAALFFPLLAGLALLLSLGPSSNPCHCASLYDWFARLPFVGGMRAPARFALLVILGLSVLAAAGAAAMHRRFGRLGRLVTAVVVLVTLVEAYPVRFPRAGMPVPASVPTVYRNLAQLPAGAVVSLPDYYQPNWTSPDEFVAADYIFFSTFHWQPIVNGYGRAMPSGYGWTLSQMMAFAGPHSAEAMRRLGVRYVVLHATLEPEGPVMLREALASPDYERLASADGVYLFRVRPGPGPLR